MLKFQVKNQSIEMLEREVIASDQIAFVTLKFQFGNDWKSLHKVVQFTQDNETYNLVLGTDGISCNLPNELLPGTVKMSLFGYDANDTRGLRATTVPITLHIRSSGFVSDSSTPIPPTPDLYQQLLAKMLQGVDGKSAYEIAIEHGYEGTEEQWLESLKGKDGEVPDMSEYPKTSEVVGLIEQNISPVAEQAHKHKNKNILDTITEERIENWNSTELADEFRAFSLSVNETLVSLQEQINNIGGGKNITLFQSGDDALTEYGDSIYTYYNNGFNSLKGFATVHPNFCSADNHYTLSYNQTDFSWAGEILTICLMPFHADSNTGILFSYNSGATQSGDMYIIAADSSKSASDAAQFIQSQIAENKAMKLDFQWLQSGDFISTIITCGNTPSGEYYLAWKGVSDNTHPQIRTVKVMRG